MPSLVFLLSAATLAGGAGYAIRQYSKVKKAQKRETPTPLTQKMAQTHTKR